MKFLIAPILLLLFLAPAYADDINSFDITVNGGGPYGSEQLVGTFSYDSTTDQILNLDFTGTGLLDETWQFPVLPAATTPSVGYQEFGFPENEFGWVIVMTDATDGFIPGQNEGIGPGVLNYIDAWSGQIVETPEPSSLLLTLAGALLLGTCAYHKSQS